MATYRFDCGCEWPVIEERGDGVLPLMDFSLEKMPEDCPAVWELLSRGLTQGVFQLEKKLGQAWAKKLAPTSNEHLGALGALLRPGCLMATDEDGVSMAQHYVRRKNGKEEVSYYHPSLEPILNKTYGTLVYQESSMAICRELAGFDLKQADMVRKCVTGDTQFVSRTRGWVSINTLVDTGYEGEEFLVLDEFGRSQWKRLEKVWSTGKKKVFTVESSTGFRVRATRHHQFLTDSGWKARMKLVEDQDYLVAARRVEYDGEDRVGRELAIVIAGILTEGHFVEERRGTFVNHDEFTMNLYLDCYEKVFGRRPTTADTTVSTVREKEKRLLSQYIPFGLSDSRVFPEVMMGMTLETTRDFLSFTLAAEGGVTVSSGQFEWSSKSLKFALQVKLLLLRFGIRSYILSKKTKVRGGEEHDYYRLYVNDGRDQEKLLRELTELWPEWKKTALQEAYEKKSCRQFTTDIVPVSITTKLLNQYPSAGNYESGTVYKSPLSRERFLRIANSTLDPLWVQLAAGSQQYDTVKDISYVDRADRLAETHDFTVEGGDTPYIVANGLVIHNSIGKKLPEEMAKVKKMFLDGAESKGIVTREQAEQIFGWIESSQKYSFNCAHSISYGLTGYDTAYLKAHFPHAFFTAWLATAKDKANPREEVYLLVQDAKLFNVDVLPPDLRTLEPHFHTDGKVVRFGISDVKGLGDAQLRKMVAGVEKGEGEVGKKLADFTWLEFLLFLTPHLSSSVVNSLILTGALPWFGLPRRLMLAEFGAWNDLSTAEQKWARDLVRVQRGLVDLDEARSERGRLEAELKSLKAAKAAKPAEPSDEWNRMVSAAKSRLREVKYLTSFSPLISAPVNSLTDLLALVGKGKKEGGGCANAKRVSTVQSLLSLLQSPPTPLVDTPAWIADVEEELLGISLTFSRVDSCDLSEVNTSCKDYIAGKTGFMLLGVEVREVEQKRTKKGKSPGSKMASLTLADASGAVRAVCFPDAYKEFGSLFVEGNTIIVQAERPRDTERGDDLIIKRAWQATQAV